MGNMLHHHVVSFLLGLGIILIFSRLMAELTRRIALPPVVGEILAGIILGPTILGMLSPEIFDFIFPFINDPVKNRDLLISMDSIVSLSVIMLLFIAGLEVEMPIIIKQGKVALLTTVLSMLIPISIGFIFVWFFPDLLAYTNNHDKYIYAFFIGVLLSITALPVIARILMDLAIFRSKIGMTIIASAMLIDLLGWLIFSVLLSLIETRDDSHSIGYTIISIILFGTIMLTFGTKLINKSLPWIQSKFSFPGGVLALGIGFALIAAAFTESIGIHSILGAFIIGISIGDASNLKERTKDIINQFVSNIFAPIFFVSIGLYVNFLDNFDWKLISILFVLAFISKVLGATMGARLGGLKKRKSLAVGLAMNTHGALEIILGTIALNVGLITEEMFVAIVAMVVISIIIAAPLLKLVLKNIKV